ALEQAGNWLCVHDERHGFLSNHLAAAAGALAHAHRICGHSRFEDRGRHFLGKILDHQSDEGWFDEYGGADPGYQTHGSFYLARYLDLTGAGELIDSLKRSFAFLAHFVHADGSLGGEYASRNTQTYYPAALEMMADRSEGAKWIAETMRPSVATLAAAGLGSVDAYNYFPLLNNAVFAYLACMTRADAQEESSAGVAAGAVLDSKDLLFDPNLREREFYEVVPHHPATGIPPLPYASRPWKMSLTPAVPGKAGPTMGEHNSLVLSGLLGHSDEELAALEEEGVIGYAPTNPRPVQRPSLEEQVRQGRMQRFETDFAKQVESYYPHP
ncbi:MAG: CoA transferase, partial [Planctomycetes bacterium]|nr:CoA transferase [Planctomycetota bacterium]